jgi:transcriptional regulator with XRE-family HTH domain
MDINSRFLNTYNFLLNSRLVTNKADFAKKLGISNSMITDISKNRTKPGLSVLRNIVLNFPEINIEWLIAGEGEMLKKDVKSASTPVPNEGKTPRSLDQIDDSTPHNCEEYTGNVTPNRLKNVTPTVTPTPSTCPICAEKERVIESMEITIEALMDANQVLKDRLEDCLPKKQRKAG